MPPASPAPEKPTELAALVARAQGEHRAGRLVEAEAIYRQILAAHPDSAEVYYELAHTLKDQEKLGEAQAACERAVSLKPDFFRACTGLGIIFQRQGRFEQALASYARALTINPRDPDAHCNLAGALKELGKLDEARAHYDQALALRPNYAEAHYLRSELKTFRAHDADLAALEALAADPSRLPAGKMVFIHFALGKALDDVGDYGRAFAQWLQGNALKRREVHYDELAYQQAVRTIAHVFDSNMLDRFQGLGDPSPAPIFVVGMPRSGSTLIEQILASHPQVQAVGELTNLDRIVRTTSESDGRPIPFPACLERLDACALRRLGQDYLASLPALAGGKCRITDKMPTNFGYVGLIRLILPNARIVHTMRDPVDTCVSCFSKIFGSGYTFSYDLAELGCYYRWYHELMDHWRSILPAGVMLDVPYENVVDNLEEQARRLIDFCGLPWDDRCLNFHETKRPVATASNVQVRQPIYRSSIARWRRYEAYLRPLLAELESCR